jgi:hypothetical protein
MIIERREYVSLEAWQAIKRSGKRDPQQTLSATQHE